MLWHFLFWLVYLHGFIFFFLCRAWKQKQQKNERAAARSSSVAGNCNSESGDDLSVDKTPLCKKHKRRKTSATASKEDQTTKSSSGETASDEDKDSSASDGNWDSDASSSSSDISSGSYFSDFFLFSFLLVFRFALITSPLFVFLSLSLFFGGGPVQAEIQSQIQ